MTTCSCGNPDGTNQECERCRLIAEVKHLRELVDDLKRDLFEVNNELGAFRYANRRLRGVCVSCGAKHAAWPLTECSECLTKQVPA